MYFEKGKFPSVAIDHNQARSYRKNREGVITNTYKFLLLPIPVLNLLFFMISLLNSGQVMSHFLRTIKWHDSVMLADRQPNDGNLLVSTASWRKKNIY